MNLIQFEGCTVATIAPEDLEKMENELDRLRNEMNTLRALVLRISDLLNEVAP